MSSDTHKAIRWLERKIIYSVGFGVFVLLAIGIALFYLQQRSLTQERIVRIAYGAGAPVRKRFLEQMAAEGKARHLDIRLVATAGTDDTLTHIDRGDAEFGLVAGVVMDRGARKVLEVTPLYMEPLQLLVKEELFDAVLKDFGQLRDKTIDLESQSSATNLLATELLRFMGLNDPATGAPLYHPVHLSQTSITEGIEGPVPDAIFQIGGVPSGSIRNLIVRHNYRLVPLPFGAAFNLDKFREAEMPDSNANLKLNKSVVEEAIVPAFVYSVLPPVPQVDTRTIATRLTLVGGGRLDNRMVGEVLELIFSPEVSEFSKPELSVELLETNFQFARHPGTDIYLNSLKPVDVDGAFTNYGRLVEVWGLIITLYIGAAKGLKSWRQRKVSDRASVGNFLAQVIEVEAQAGPSCSAAERIELDQRLTEIKQKSIRLHLDENLDGAEELPALLTTIADTRTRIWRGATS
jgi:TRAP-type uncharacterized transport system substrate-binding protein